MVVAGHAPSRGSRTHQLFFFGGLLLTTITPPRLLEQQALLLFNDLTLFLIVF